MPKKKFIGALNIYKAQVHFWKQINLQNKMTFWNIIIEAALSKHSCIMITSFRDINSIKMAL